MRPQKSQKWKDVEKLIQQRYLASTKSLFDFFFFSITLYIISYTKIDYITFGHI